MNKKLRRSNDKMLTGVCGGIAEFFELDPTLVRVGYVLLSILSCGFPSVVAYLILTVIMPTTEA